MMGKTCMCCGGTFHVPPSRFESKKFCSAKCRKEYESSALHVEIICSHCGKEFNVYSKDLKYGKKYCSKECSDLAKQHVLALTCGHCGKEFTRLSRATTNPNNAFCSKKCRDAHKRLAEMSKCYTCGKEFYRSPAFLADNEHNFCSEACFGKWMSVVRRGENSPVFNSVKKTCEICGHEFFVPMSRDEFGHRRFCSFECRAEARKRHMLDTSRPSLCFHGPNWRDARLATLRRDSFTCQACGYKGKGLHVHHITPYRQFGGDWVAANRLDNLITLCHSCHSKQKAHHTYRKKSFHGNAVVNTGLTPCVTVESRG